MPENNNNGIGNNIPTGYNNQLIQQALGFGDQAIAQQRAGAMKNLGRIEGTMYDILGRQQLQAEQDISQRRMQALRSGQTSAQLAVQEMQNLQTRQIGAQAIAQQYDQQRAEVGQQFDGAEMENRKYMLETLNQNINNKAAVDSQVLASDWDAQMANVFGNDFWGGLDPDIKLGIISKFQGIEISSTLSDKVNEAFKAVATKAAPTKKETTPTATKPTKETDPYYKGNNNYT